ncbi:MAG TPA: hypothetical protein VJB92_01340 [Candidatus Paceibacterota bacterium]
MSKIDLADKKTSNLIRKTIIETIQEILRDSDYGLELRGWVKKRLKKSPKTLISFEDVKKKYL